MAATPVANELEGYLLLTLPSVEAWLPNASTPFLGPLAVECVTLSVPSSLIAGSYISDQRDVWLILRFDGRAEMPIPAAQIIFHDRAQRLFRFVGDGCKDWEMRVLKPVTLAEAEDLETFEVLLSQYAAVEVVQKMEAMSMLQKDGKIADERVVANENIAINGGNTASSASVPARLLGAYEGADHRNHLVLINELNGEIVGHLAENVRIREDPSVLAVGNEKAPVVVEFPDDAQEAERVDWEEGEALVHIIPYEQQDILLRGAHVLSRGIIQTTSLLSSGISAASSLYISKTVPNEKPLRFSESTHAAFRRVHHLSAVAVEVTGKTTRLINEAVESAAHSLSGQSRRALQSNRCRPLGETAAPPLPPRSRSSSHQSPPPSYSPRSKATNSSSPARKLPFLNRVLLSTDLLLTTLEASGKQILEHGSSKLSEAVGHKFGGDAGTATLQLGEVMTNVGVVYIDARGVGRRALLKRAGKTYMKAKLGQRNVEIGAPVDLVVNKDLVR